MAEKREVVRICDRCRSTNDVQKRQIRLPDERNRQVTFDACGECRRNVSLDEWEELLPGQRTGGRNLNTTPVVSGPRAVAKASEKADD